MPGRCAGRFGRSPDRESRRQPAGPRSGPRRRRRCEPARHRGSPRRNAVRPPLTFVYGNCVFARGVRDPWAAFAVALGSYAWLDRDEKRARMLALVGAIEAAEADVQILRVAGRWDPDGYGADLDAAADRRTECRRYIQAQQNELQDRASVVPSLYLLVSLTEPELDVASFLSAAASRSYADLSSRLRRAASAIERRTLAAPSSSGSGSERIGSRQASPTSFPCERHEASSCSGWCRRAFCRGLGEPAVDGLHVPRALVFERNGEAVLAPLEAMSCAGSTARSSSGARCCRSSRSSASAGRPAGRSGRVPERVEFPGPRRADVRAARSLPFAVDVALTARFLPNDLACGSRGARFRTPTRSLRAEAGGEQGVSDLGYERTQEARDLLSYLQASSRPPLLRTTSRSRSARRREPSSRQRSSCAREPTARCVCTGRSETSFSSSSSTCPAQRTPCGRL